MKKVLLIIALMGICLSASAQYADSYYEGRSIKQINDKYVVNVPQVIAGSSIVGASGIGYFLSQSILDDLMKNCDDVDDLEKYMDTKPIMGYVFSATTLIGIVVLATSFSRLLPYNMALLSNETGTGIAVKF